jgi:hypothetical protein
LNNLAFRDKPSELLRALNNAGALKPVVAAVASEDFSFVLNHSIFDQFLANAIKNVELAEGVMGLLN